MRDTKLFKQFYLNLQDSVTFLLIYISSSPYICRQLDIRYLLSAKIFRCIVTNKIIDYFFCLLNSLHHTYPYKAMNYLR